MALTDGISALASRVASEFKTQRATVAAAIQGPASSTPNAVPRFTNALGRKAKDSALTITDLGAAKLSADASATGNLLEVLLGAASLFSVSAAGIRFGSNDIPRILSQSAVAITKAGTGAADVFAAVTIPAGALGVNGRCRITALWTLASNGKAKVITSKFGGVTYLSTTVANVASVLDAREICNRGSASSQIGYGCIATGAISPMTSAVNTAAAVNIQLSCTTPTGESATLESYMVEIFPNG